MGLLNEVRAAVMDGDQATTAAVLARDPEAASAAAARARLTPAATLGPQPEPELAQTAGYR